MNRLFCSLTIVGLILVVFSSLATGIAVADPPTSDPNQILSQSQIEKAEATAGARLLVPSFSISPIQPLITETLRLPDQGTSATTSPVRKQYPSITTVPNGSNITLQGPSTSSPTVGTKEQRNVGNRNITTDPSSRPLHFNSVDTLLVDLPSDGAKPMESTR